MEHGLERALEKGIGNRPGGSMLEACSDGDRRSTCILPSESCARPGAPRETRGTFGAHCSRHGQHGTGILTMEQTRYWTHAIWPAELPPWYPDSEPLPVAGRGGGVGGGAGSGGGGAGSGSGGSGAGSHGIAPSAGPSLASHDPSASAWTTSTGGWHAWKH